MHSETDASLASSWNCRHWATGFGGRQAAHSRPSDRRRRTPNGRACCDDVVVRRDGGGWKIEVSYDCMATSDVGWQQFTSYWGALPWRHRWTVTPSLWKIRWETSSQCSSGVEQMCQASVELPSITDDAGWGIQSVVVLGDPANTVLHRLMCPLKVNSDRHLYLYIYIYIFGLSYRYS